VHSPRPCFIYGFYLFLLCSLFPDVGESRPVVCRERDGRESFQPLQIHGNLFQTAHQWSKAAGL